MKVGTDGVLLGAWSAAAHKKNILDIGTGTGLIALMMAQRNPDAQITGIEINKEAYLQACENVNDSPWADRVNICHIDFKTYQTENKFDLIVSNPPFFTNSLLGPDHKRNLARHTTELTYTELLRKASTLLSANGELDIIFPAGEESYIKEQSLISGLTPCRQLNILPTPDAPVKRILLGFSFSEKECVSHQIIIETARHQYSDEYISLTREFYLKM